MTRPGPEVYASAIAEESRRFREVLAGCEPHARVPGCPDWDASDLLWHLTEVQHFWAWVVGHRPQDPDAGYAAPRRPDEHARLLALAEDSSRALSSELSRADPAEAAWSWAPDQTVGFTLRRQAHEALIHRLDAEQTAGAVTPLDPALAADGVEECLDVMYGGCPDWGSWAGSGRHVEVRLTDVGTSVWCELGRFSGTHPTSGEVADERDLHVVADPGRPADATVSGGAGDVDAWLWSRVGDDAVRLDGDPATLAGFREVVAQPLR